MATVRRWIAACLVATWAVVVGAGGALAEPPGHGARPLDPVRALRHAATLVRSAGEAFAYGADPEASAGMLRDARDILHHFEADPYLRRADAAIAQALGDLLSPWLGPEDKRESLRHHGREAIRSIQRSPVYASGWHGYPVVRPGAPPAGRHGWAPGGEGGPPPAGRAPGMPLVAHYVKTGYEPAALTIPIGQYTADRSYSTLVVDVRRTDRFTVIVSTVFVRVGGRWEPHPIAHRTAEGRNTYPVPIPAGATELKLSLDHGQGSELTVYLR